MESKGLKKSFPTLSLYCNWYMHPMLDREELGWQILADVDAALWDSSQAPNAAIGTALRWETLRSEATDLFASQEINAGLFIHDGNWISFSSALLNDLREKPIRWPTDPSTNKRSRHLFAQMMQRSTLGRPISMLGSSRSTTGVKATRGLGSIGPSSARGTGRLRPL